METEIEDDTFLQALQNVNLLTNNTKMRSFQFRFLCHSLVTNKKLKEWGLSDTDRCTFCRDHYETQEHLFLNCTETRRFFEQVLIWFECLTDSEFNLDKTQLALLSNKKITTVDRVLLLAKPYVYSIRCANKELNIYNFKKHVFKIVRLEKYMAVKLNREKQFCKQWATLLK